MRLFCLPHAGAGPSAFRGWQQAFGASVEVVPVHLPGRESRIDEPPETSMARLAERLTEPIAQRAGRLPYAIFGHSMGALLGYELAYRLGEAGRSPVLLVASGASAPQLEIDTGTPIHTMPEDELVAHLAELAGTPRSVLSRRELLDAVLPAIRADFAACETYVHRDRPPLAIPLLVLGGDQDPAVPVASLDGWCERSTASVHVEVYPGGHFFHHDDPDAVLERIHRELSQAARTAVGAASAEQAVRRYYSLVDAQDFVALVELFSERAVYRRPGYAPLVGHKALTDFYGGERVIVDGRHSISELVVDGTRVAVNGDFAGTVRGGRQVELRFADFFEMGPDGLFASRETFFFAPLV